MKGKTLKGEISKNVAWGSTVMTDEFASYNGLSRQYRHESVKHGRGQYVREGGIHINSVEGMWALFKRQYHGTHHWISPKHMDA